jgi:hypothetical protein
MAFIHCRAGGIERCRVRRRVGCLATSTKWSGWATMRRTQSGTACMDLFTRQAQRSLQLPVARTRCQWLACCAIHVLPSLCTGLACRPVGLPRACTALPNLLRLLNPPTLCLFSRATSSALDIPLCWLRSSSLASSRLSPCTTLRLPGEHALCLPLVRAWAVNQPPAAGLRSLVGVRCPCMGSCLSRRMSRRLRHNCHVMILAVWRVLCACSPCL